MKNAPLITSIEQCEKFLKTNKDLGVKYEILSVKGKYEFIKKVKWSIKYVNLNLADKCLVLSYLKLFTGYSKSHLKRLMKKAVKGRLSYNPGRKRNKFRKKYFPSDIALLIETDCNHQCLSGEATKRILLREYETFEKNDYATISQISVAHIYNIRNNNLQYNSSDAKFFKRTKASEVDIGIRRKPVPNGKPGYLRVDTVHQGDYLGNKGVYHINIVDEITQYELISTVPRITEKYLKPVIEEMLRLFPFVVYEFHADNGSEYINKTVAKLLNKIHVELTKSRSRHSNDNALVESKNGSIIRKFYGRNYIDKKWADKINGFNRKYLNVYLIYHRPSGFAEDVADKNGKIKKKYNQWITPYEKFKSLKNAKQYLKPNFSFAEMDKQAYEKSDNEFAKEMNKAKKKIFKLIYEKTKPQNRHKGIKK